MSERSPLIEVALGPSAIDHVRSRLRNGHRFAAALEARLPRFVGRISTWVPPGVPTAALEDFGSGGKIGIGAASPASSRVLPVPNADPALAALAQVHLQQPGNPAVLFEDAYATRGDPYLARRKSRLAYFGDEVLHAVVRGDSRAAIEAAIRESRAVPTFVGAFTELPPGAVVEAELTAAELDHLAEATTLIFVGAYDGESFVALRRAEAPAGSRGSPRALR